MRILTIGGGKKTKPIKANFKTQTNLKEVEQNSEAGLMNDRKEE